jgi:hypothetical protein
MPPERAAFVFTYGFGGGCVGFGESLGTLDKLKHLNL